MIQCPYDGRKMAKIWECCSFMFRYECGLCGRIFTEEPSFKDDKTESRPNLSEANS